MSHRILFSLVTLLCFSGLAEEAPETLVPLEPPEAVAGETVAAPVVSPWFEKLPSLYEVTRSETLDTNLDGRAIWYKNRGPSEVKLQAFIMRNRKDASYLNVFVPSLTRETSLRGNKQRLTFDASLYEVKEKGQRVELYNVDGSEKDQETLTALTKEPWYELRWGGGAWTKTVNVAKNLAWPLADGLCLDRELTVLLPNLATLNDSLKITAQKGETFQQVVVLPYPAPLSPALTMAVTYTVERVFTEKKQQMIALTFSGSLNQHRPDGISWGGINMEQVRTASQLSGTLVVNLSEMVMHSATLSLQTQFERTTTGESFSSNWKVSSAWERVSETD